MRVKVASDETEGPPRLFAVAALSVGVGIFSGIVAASFVSFSMLPMAGARTSLFVLIPGASLVLYR